MRKIIFLLLSFIFLGCAKKDFIYINKYDPTKAINNRIKLLDNTLNDKLYYAEGASYSKFGGISEEKLIEFILKNIAKKTLDSGKKYFFIVSPKEVSNYDGRVINTIEGFQENINYVRSSNKCKCSNKITCEPFILSVVFVILKEKSMDYIVWDAKKVLDD